MAVGNIDKLKKLQYYLFMNCMCVQGRDYLNSPISNKEELIKFIDKFNNKLNEYSYNGLSSYFLESVEVSIKLSRSVSYNFGEAFGRLVKGNTLATSGQYSLAIASFRKGLCLLESDSQLRNNLYLKLIINLLIVGREDEALEYLESLKELSTDHFNLANIFYNQHFGTAQGEFTIPVAIKDIFFENYFTLSSMFKNSIGDDKLSNSVLEAIERSMDRSSCNIDIHLESLKCLSLKRDNIGERVKEIIAQFNKREFFVLYIDGLLNIAETLIKFNLPDNASNLLSIIETEKREVSIFNPRLEELKIRTQAVLTI